MGQRSAWAVATPVTRLVTPGPERGEADTRLARDAGVGVSGHGGRLLVTDVDELEPLLDEVGRDASHRAAQDEKADLHSLVH